MPRTENNYWKDEFMRECEENNRLIKDLFEKQNEIREAEKSYSFLKLRNEQLEEKIEKIKLENSQLVGKNTELAKVIDSLSMNRCYDEFNESDSKQDKIRKFEKALQAIRCLAEIL
jgi:predicted nuclease with TOPRIM domain